MNNKGNAVAVILVVVAIVIVLAVSTQYSPLSVPEPITQSNQKIQSETTFTIDEALELGTIQFLEKGFSSKSNVWYYNYTLVPDINHTDNSYNFLINSSLSKFLTTTALVPKEYSISYYDVDVNAFVLGDSHNFDRLDDKEVDFDINVFMVSKDGSKILKAPEKETIGYSVWMMYKTLYSWVAQNPNFFGNVVTSSVENSVPAMISSCSCDRNSTLNYNVEKKYCTDMGKNILNDINSQIQNELKRINDLFYSSRITCNASITNYSYDCDDVRRKQFCIYTETETAAYKCLSKSRKAATYSKFIEWTEKKQADPIINNLKAPQETYYFPDEKTLFPYSNTNGNSINDEIVCAPPAVAKEDVIALNPKIFAELKITCVDYSRIIGLLDVQKNLSSEIVLKVAARRDITPTQGIALVDNLDTTCAGGGGGSGGPGEGGGKFEPCIPPSTLCIKTGVGCYFYECYEAGKARPILDGNGNKIHANCCSGGIGPKPGCTPENTCFKVSGTEPNCVQTPKDCSLDKCSTGECNPMLPDGCVPKDLTDDGNKCTIERCDTATGEIKHDPKICYGGDPPCKVMGCNQDTGDCEVVDEIKCALDGNYCTQDICVSSKGGICEHPERSCGKSTNCIKRDCNSFSLDITDGEQGKCETNEVICNDMNACTNDSCSNSSGGCQYSTSTPPTTPSYKSCGALVCDASTGTWNINNPVDCSESTFLTYSPKECFNWNNTCFNGNCINAPTPKCNEYVKQFCYPTSIELSAHGCTSVDSPASNCCYTTGQ